MRLLFILVRTLTFKKLSALFQAQISFIAARVLGVNIRSSALPYVTIEPTNRCQLKCPECVTGCGLMERMVGDISLEQFKLIVDQIYPHTIVLNLYMQGEPYLNSDLPKMIAYAKQKNLFVSLSTNGQRLPVLESEALPHHMIVSVDGATQESYESYRREGKLSKVQDFVAQVALWKCANNVSLPYVELQFLLHRKNETEAKATRALFKGHYDRFVVKSMQIINEENAAEFLPVSASVNRYAKEKKIRRGCAKMLTTAVFTHEGELALCCMDKNAEYVRGNIFHDTYQSLLNNDKARLYRKKLLKNKQEMPICANCPFA